MLSLLMVKGGRTVEISIVGREGEFEAAHDEAAVTAARRLLNRHRVPAYGALLGYVKAGRCLFLDYCKVPF